MINHKVLSLIGLAMKAGKVVSGEFSTEKAVKTGTAFLVVVAESVTDENFAKAIEKQLEMNS